LRLIDPNGLEGKGDDFDNGGNPEGKKPASPESVEDELPAADNSGLTPEQIATRDNPDTYSEPEDTVGTEVNDLQQQAAEYRRQSLGPCLMEAGDQYVKFANKSTDQGRESVKGTKALYGYAWTAALSAGNPVAVGTAILGNTERVAADQIGRTIR
jgi:hypothetical protein